MIRFLAVQVMLGKITIEQIKTSKGEAVANQVIAFMEGVK